MVWWGVFLVALCAAQASAYVKPAPFASHNAFNPRVAADRRPARAALGSVRLIHGQDAAPGQFPHQVALYIDMAAFCGGALIAPRWVLTAATCTSSASRPRYTAFLGAQSINLPAEKNRKAVTTTASYAHEDFDAETKKNDIALILLPRAVPTSEYIKPINLPPRSYASRNFAGTALQMSGWGYVSDSSDSISPTLRYVDLLGITNVQCVETYSYDVITDDILCCTGQDSQSPCHGDTGGALVLKEADGSLTHVAVASFTPRRGCGLGLPSGYTRTASYLDWIASTTGIAA